MRSMPYFMAAILNSNLLHKILGYMAKLLAKQCEIGDASRGSLSSYAYTLMVIHYLQQVKPPVIPVLQEVLSTISSVCLLI